MAKRKRAPHEKPFSRPMPKSVVETPVSTADHSLSPASSGPPPGDTDGGDAATDELNRNDTPSSAGENRGATTESGGPDGSVPGVADPFVGQWNRLISTTNWEKGQIICAWRQALQTAGEAVTEYSDEAWAQLVGGVTSQHVGRLRRVSQRFGAVYQQYDGLHWSHFQACLDWEDAEMWLEGSIQNGWSVSQMRGKRWETVGTTPEEQRAEVIQAAAEEDSEAHAEAALAGREAADQPDTLSPSTTEVDSLGDDSGIGAGAEASSLPSPDADSPSAAESADQVSKRTRLSVDVESLPDDLAEAFESFKLAIIAHRRENWRDTTPESVVECLESLRQLALADSD